MKSPDSNLGSIPPKVEKNTEIELKKIKEKLTKAQTEIKELRAALEKAHIDITTGLWRDDLLEPKINKLVEELSKIDNRRPSNKIGLMIIVVDIDDFKNFNNKYGHIVGNKALSALGARLKQAQTRDETDSSFRFGGDECVMVLPFESDKDVSDETVREVFDRTRINVNDNLFIEVDDEKDSNTKKRLSITVAMGYTFFRKGERALDAKVLFDLADKNLYKDKVPKVKEARMNKAGGVLV